MNQLTNGQILTPSISYIINNTSTSNQKFSICYYNMRSIVRRMAVLETSIASLSFCPDVIVITETRIFDIEAALFNLDGYRSFHSARPYSATKNRGGGTAIFVKDRVDLQCNMASSVHFEDANILVVKLIRSNIHIVSVYRPEQTSMDSFFSEFDRTLSSYRRSLVIGDMNINLLDRNDSDVKNYTHTVHSNGFCILNKIDVMHVTRISNTISTILDHIVTDILDKTFEMTYTDTSISDHRQLVLKFFEHAQVIMRNKATSTIDYERIDSMENWDVVKSAKTLQEFEKAIQSIIESYSRQKRRCTKKKPMKPWITKNILNLIQRRESLFKFHKRFPTFLLLGVTNIMQTINCNCNRNNQEKLLR